MIINKWFFKDFKEDISNKYFRKTIPFCTFSELSNPRYDLIEALLNNIPNYDKSTFISIGRYKAPFGMTLYPQEQESMETLLNSCDTAFIFSDKIRETNYLIKSVLAGITPVCNKNHLYIKRLGLSRFAITPNLNELIDKVGYLFKHSYLSSYYIWYLSQKYRRQWRKWNK